MPPGIMDSMATGVPSQTVGTQGSLGRSATCVQPIPALPGDGPAEKLDLSSRAPRRDLTDVGNDVNNLEEPCLDRFLHLLLRQ